MVEATVAVEEAEVEAVVGPLHRAQESVSQSHMDHVRPLLLASVWTKLRRSKSSSQSHSGRLS